MQNKQKPKYCLSQQTDTIKNRVHAAIAQNNIEKIKSLFDAHKIYPNEELSVAGHYWTLLHYACHFGVHQILRYLIKKVYEYYPKEFSEVINTSTVEGYTPFMCCAIYGQEECIQTLLQFGGIEIKATDVKDQTALDQAKYYQRHNITPIIEKISKNNLNNGKTPINFNLLNKKEFEANGTNIEDKDEYQSLLKYGIRLPCILCLTNKGWLKYTECCGQPLHFLCQKEIFKCPVCSESPLVLTTDVRYPDRAFTLEE